MSETKDKIYDVVIVGSGIAGSLIAKYLTQKGKTVLLLEAGTGSYDLSQNWKDYQEYMKTFFMSQEKGVNSAYPVNLDAPSPSLNSLSTPPDDSGYFVQMGPQNFGSNFVRINGGTTQHWLGTCLRMLPDDFRMKSTYGVEVDWPITYDDLENWYGFAEYEIGVSADVDEQDYLGIKFPKGYRYPMRKIPQSYLDQKLTEGLKGKTIEFENKEYPVKVVSTPQGRNSTPDPDYRPVGFEPTEKWKKGEKGFQVEGAVSPWDLGARCEGNSNCIPICPVQAKYNATRSLFGAKRENMEVKFQAVASEVEFDPETNEVKAIWYKRYEDKNSPEYTLEKAVGKVFVLAANAIENAKLMLASEKEKAHPLMGKNLMDHPVLLGWGLLPEPIGAFRGPGSTSGIPSLRNGDFRKNRAAFRIEIGNWGWSWPDSAPYKPLIQSVDEYGRFGKNLRETFKAETQRQFRFGFLIEQDPQVSNSVTISPNYKDRLGNYRPIINYNFSDYTKNGFVAALKTYKEIFKWLNVENYTNYNPSESTYFEYEGIGFSWGGAGHIVGTHKMGLTEKDGVVDSYQRSFDHANLFIAGCGSMPTIGTSNPTLTMAALCLRTAA